MFRYFVWGTVLTGLIITLGTTLFLDTSDPYVWGYQILGVIISGIGVLVAVVGKAGEELRNK